MWTELRLVGQDRDQMCKPEDEGLRMHRSSAKLPTNSRSAFGCSFRSIGDFEITGSYELLSSEPASGAGSWPVGVALNVSIKNDYSKPFAKIGRFALAERGHAFVVESWNKEKSKQQTWRRVHCCGLCAHPGKLRIVREGSTLSYQASDGPIGCFP